MCNSTDTACKLLNENDYFSQKQDKETKMNSNSHVFFLPSQWFSYPQTWGMQPTLEIAILNNLENARYSWCCHD